MYWYISQFLTIAGTGRPSGPVDERRRSSAVRSIARRRKRTSRSPTDSDRFTDRRRKKNLDTVYWCKHGFDRRCRGRLGVIRRMLRLPFAHPISARGRAPECRRCRAKWCAVRSPSAYDTFNLQPFDEPFYSSEIVMDFYSLVSLIFYICYFLLLAFFIYFFLFYFF